MSDSLIRSSINFLCQKNTGNILLRSRPSQIKDTGMGLGLKGLVLVRNLEWPGAD